MITFEQENQKQSKMLRDDREIITLDLLSSSITNKFYIITNFITRLSENFGSEFDDWLENFIIEYCNSEERFKVYEKNVSYIKYYVDQYIENSDIDFSKFVDESKVKKNSIYFSIEDIKLIIKVSSYLKIYTLFSNSKNLKLNQTLHRKAYNKLFDEIFETDIIDKIFTIIRTKTFRYKLTDKYMWDYIKTVQCKSIDYYVIEIFNFIMNQILVMCEETRNPITYFIGVVDESVKWFLRSVYKGSIIYNDSISTEDIQGINVNNLRTYSYNDTIGRLKGISYEYIYEEIERGSIYKFNKNENETITEFQNRVSEIEYVSPLSECLIYPLLSRATDIPYNHFKTLSAEHSAIISLFVKHILKKVFNNNEYKSLFDLLEYYPTSKPSVATTYKIKNTDYFVKVQNDIKNFFGFQTKILPYDIIRHFVGRVSRIGFKSVMNGRELTGVPLSQVESEMVLFYTNFFAGNLDDKISQFSDRLYSHF